MPELADRVAVFFKALSAESCWEGDEHPLDGDLVALLDPAFIEASAYALRLLTAVEGRGCMGWTNIKRVTPAV